MSRVWIREWALSAVVAFALAVSTLVGSAACESSPSGDPEPEDVAADTASDAVGADAATGDVVGPDVGDPDVVTPEDIGPVDVLPNDASGLDVPSDVPSADIPLGDVGGEDVPYLDVAEPDVSEADTGGPCVPDCDGRACGPDGCGGTCGTCDTGLHCNLAQGTCEEPPCIPRCGARACGDDGCGGSCGLCEEPEFPVCVDGVCEAECVPDCRKKACGPDGCGGVCGACVDGHGCSVHGHCVPHEWSCAPASYDGGDGCHCGCGAPDPDCERFGALVVGCDDHYTCEEGVCVSVIPDGWTCDVFQYDDGDWCHCGCGLWDPDCDDPTTLPLGCSPGSACEPDTATCAECVPDCGDRVCGDDGCGTSCGACGTDELGNPLACVDGQCVDGCLPEPLVCERVECGDDGCGGSCGACAPMTTCVEGFCKIDAGMSCFGYCGAAAPGGCSCDLFCEENGDCCPDYVAQCTCVPDCDGRECGDDGCGLSCGSCEDPGLPHCDADGQCRADCQPQCDGRQCGGDGCGGECGTCGDGESCNWERQCVPASWLCAPDFYGDGAACDCSCGAPDPDCFRVALTLGCPTGSPCDAATGYCQAPFCDADVECPAPQWCVGDYPNPSGDQVLRGICEAPYAAAAPTGHLCGADSECATGLCVAGRCRHHCLMDESCYPGERCLTAPVHHPLSGRYEGLVRFCTNELGLGEPCAAQTDCPSARCLAFANAGDLAVHHLCGTPVGGGILGHVCDPLDPCALGLVCADGFCALPCPAGQTDCPAGQTCREAELADGFPVDACHGM